MDKLIFLVCENFYLEYKKIVEDEGFEDVFISPYPSVCENKSKKNEIINKLEETASDGYDYILICSKYCDLLKWMPEKSKIKVHTSNFCFNKLVNDEFMKYIISKGSYVISSSWLKNWKQHIETQGFDKETARKFYGEFCNELIFLNAGIIREPEILMDELLAYLDIPYTIIPVELEPIRLMVVNKVYEWKLQKMQHSHVKSLAKAQRQCAEYSSIVDLMGKIAVCTTRREVIGKIKEIFSLVFGVEYFKYWSANYDQGTIPADIEEFMVDQGKEFIFSNEDKRFSIKISWKGKLYGVIDVWGFMFPQYFEKYLNFALEISKICGVVFSNIEQYEKVMISEQELRYISYHDSSTGLFNRSYINDYASKYDPKQQPTVFAFDIDRLKLVNDNYGHAEGDKLIKSVADILLRCFRETDVVARIGGDEFVAIIPGDNMLTALLIKDRITQEIDIENKDIEDPDRKISFSIGVAISQSESDTLESLMQKADEFMYADKISKRQ